MRSQSGNARMDHMGRCDEGSQDETPDQMCARVKTSGKCAYTRENCSHRVQPEEGCCPVCGKREVFGTLRTWCELELAGCVPTCMIVIMQQT